MASLPILSPDTAMGIAGGQDTAGAPHIRPNASLTGITSWGRKNASRTDIALSALAMGSSSCSAGLLRHSPSTFSSLYSSSKVLLGVVMSTA